MNVSILHRAQLEQVSYGHGVAGFVFIQSVSEIIAVEIANSHQVVPV